MKKQTYRIDLLILSTLFALLPGYLIRYQERIYIWFFKNFSTYPGDLWNFWQNYLQKQGAIYPPEYPVGLRFFYELMRFDKYDNYFQYFNVNTAILSLFAVGITVLLYKILKKNQNNYKNSIWVFWIFAPSFIVYSFINYDLPVVFLIVLALYLFLKKKYYGAITSLAIGTVLKVFPIFLVPIFILKSPKKDWWKLGLVFTLIVIGFNLPYMAGDFSKWAFPYTWQIGQNLSKGPENGTYWWMFYNFLGDKMGWMSLGLFGLLYLFTWFKLRKTSIINLCIAVILIFLFTDRIYSPQYNLYLLPFLVLAPYMVNKKAFYLLEIPNAIHILCLFWLKEHAMWLQFLVLLKYVSIIWLYVDNYKKSFNSGVKEENVKT